MAKDPNERLMQTIGMMGVESSAGDGEAVNAFRAATRMLKDAGLTWRDVAQRSFGTTSSYWKSAPAPTPQPAPTAAPDAGPAPKPETREKMRISGRDIPVTVMGIIRALDSESKARKSEVLIFEVETETVIYGPMAAYAGTLMDNVFKARGKRAMLRIRPARDGRLTPQVVGCSPM